MISDFQVWVQVGGYSDGETFVIYVQYLEKGFLLSDVEKLSNNEVMLLHVLVGDCAYSVKSYLMKPYSKRNLAIQEEIFNYRLSQY